MTAERKKKSPRLLSRIGPGLITGASDDDPSGIGTYSQVGAQFGFGLLWTMLFSYPLMFSIQEISARIGRTTGHGIAGNLRRHYSKAALYFLVSLLLVANTLNLGADLGAMGASLTLVLGGSPLLYAFLFGVVSLVLQIFVPYTRYVSYLRWLTLAIFSYVATAFTVSVPWGKALEATIVPRLSFTAESFAALIAVLGTTISPYLFFWQASQECEDLENSPLEKPLRVAPKQAPDSLRRIRLDTFLGMGISNLVAFFIILTSAVTLHANGVTHIETAEQAAQALRPLAGNFAFFLFTLGIVGTGLLAIPILAGASAYAMAEAFQWPVGLERKPLEAKAFYAIIAGSTLVGVALNLFKISPIKALFWSATINGIVAVPVMIFLMHMATRQKIMGRFVIPQSLRIGGWVATAVMGAAVVLMAWSCATIPR